MENSELKMVRKSDFSGDANEIPNAFIFYIESKSKRLTEYQFKFFQWPKFQ